VHVLVIGGTRFVGYFLVWRLLARGDQVTILNRGTLPDPFGTRVERLHGDRSKGDFARLVAGRSFDAAVDFVAYNRRDVDEVVGSLKTRHYVFISTGQVYLVKKSCPRPAREEDYAGSVMARPQDPDEQWEWDYGKGKRDAEDVLRGRTDFRSTRIRIPIVNGERDTSRRLEGYLWRALDGGPVLLPDGGDNRVRHVYGRDVARTVADLLGNAATFGRAYNLANDETPMLRELVSLLADELGARSRVVGVTSKRLLDEEIVASRISPFSSYWQSFLEPAKARSEIGWKPTPLAVQAKSIVASFLARIPDSPPDGYASRSLEIDLAKRLERVG